MRIKAMAVLRVIGAVGAIAVNQPAARIRQIAMPDFIGTFRKRQTGDFAAAVWIEQTKLDTLRMR